MDENAVGAIFLEKQYGTVWVMSDGTNYNILEVM
jgi:hypothetical protein